MVIASAAVAHIRLLLGGCGTKPGSWPKFEKLSPSSSPSSTTRCRVRLLLLLRLVLAELLLGGSDQAEIMLGVLIVVFGGDRVAGGARVARELDIFFGDVRGGAADLDVGSVRIRRPGSSGSGRAGYYCCCYCCCYSGCASACCFDRFSCRAFIPALKSYVRLLNAVMPRRTRASRAPKRTHDAGLILPISSTVAFNKDAFPNRQRFIDRRTHHISLPKQAQLCCVSLQAQYQAFVRFAVTSGAALQAIALNRPAFWNL